MLLLYQRQKKNYTVTVCFINTIRHNFTKKRKTVTLFYPEQTVTTQGDLVVSVLELVKILKRREKDSISHASM